MKALKKQATGRNIIILLVLFLLANMVIVPAVYPRFKTLHTLPSYTPQQARQIIAFAGNDGR